MPGTLFIVATPIGNLQDLTLRGLEVLKAADIVACEDTRRTVHLLTHFDIKKPLVSYFQHNRRRRGPELLAALQAGKNVALVTDAGTPGISDPGSDLVREARAADIAVVPIPGPSAMVTLLSVSGYDGAVLWLGFLPPKSAARRRLLQENQQPALLIFEGPHRIAKTLADILAVLGDRRIVCGREMTKIHEEIRHTTVATLAAGFKERPPRGEYTLLVLPLDSR